MAHQNGLMGQRRNGTPLLKVFLCVMSRKLTRLVWLLSFKTSGFGLNHWLYKRWMKRELPSSSVISNPYLVKLFSPKTLSVILCSSYHTFYKMSWNVMTASWVCNWALQIPQLDRYRADSGSETPVFFSHRVGYRNSVPSRNQIKSSEYWVPIKK